MALFSRSLSRFNSITATATKQRTDCNETNDFKLIMLLLTYNLRTHRRSTFSNHRFLCLFMSFQRNTKWKQTSATTIENVRDERHKLRERIRCGKKRKCDMKIDGMNEMLSFCLFVCWCVRVPVCVWYGVAGSSEWTQERKEENNVSVN